MLADASHADLDRFSAVVDRHAAHLYDYCRALLADPAEAADAARATLVIAFALLDRLQDIGRVRAWLLALARRECKSADPPRSLVMLSPHPAGASGIANEPAIGEHRLRQLSAGATLTSLPPADREVLDLVYRHYLSSADVAAVLGVPADTASEMLAAAITSFERARLFNAYGSSAGASTQAARAEGGGALVAGVRVISAIPLAALPPSVLPGALGIAGDPEFASYRDSLTSTIGDLGPDGFPRPVRDLSRKRQERRALWCSPLVRYLAVQKARAGLVPRGRLALVGALVAALGVALAAMASSSSGMPDSITHAIGQALGQNPAGTSRPSARRAAPVLPITSLLPKKQAQGMMLPVLQPAPGPTSSHKPRPAPSSTKTPSPSPTPTSASPTATPTSPSVSPTSPPPTPTNSPTPTATP
ncbi:MAG TPA: sigma-70 family RNA polymerase sigma factor [Streptosporangiaceae bacterium]|nr:sigma-70 family RNA polymerase sigma factor [Streptosporangiaceae bacterium]